MRLFRRHSSVRARAMQVDEVSQRVPAEPGSAEIATPDAPPEADAPAAPTSVVVALAEQSKARYCRGCLYDLSGLEISACPECGSEFDPENPATTLSRPIPPWRHTLRRRVLIVMLFMLVVVGFMNTILPRPADPRDWRLWVWLWQPYGYQRTWQGNNPGSISWWAGKAYHAERHTHDGVLIWRMEREGEDSYKLRVAQTGARWNDLIENFNVLKRSLFAVTFEQPERSSSVGAFEIEGTRVDVLSGLVKHFGVDLTPHRINPDQTYVWDFDPDLERMVTIPLTPETRREYRFRAGAFDWPLIPAEAAVRPQDGDADDGAGAFDAPRAE